MLYVGIDRTLFMDITIKEWSGIEVGLINKMITIFG